MFKKNFLKSCASFATILSIILGASIVHVELAFAASLTTLSDSLSSVKANTLSDHTIQFVTPTGILVRLMLQVLTLLQVRQHHVQALLTHF
jgi:hypothetical protein